MFVVTQFFMKVLIRLPFWRSVFNFLEVCILEKGLYEYMLNVLYWLRE